MFNIETPIVDQLLMRAEFAAGFVGFADAMYECKPTFDAIQEVCGTVTIWCDDAEAAEWQSLLTREVILSGGL